MSRILIAYFTGTFGTEKVAKELHRSLAGRDVNAELFPIDLSKIKSYDEINDKIKGIDRLVLAYPVYSFDAPKPVLKWINTLPDADGTKASVISISAGGEARANRASRQRCILKLKRRGYRVDYEKMVTMPSNFAASGEEKMNVLLVKAAPVVAKNIADDIIANTEQRNRMYFSFGKSIVAPMFRYMARFFGKSLKLNDKCTDCKLCQNSCPTANLTIEDGKIISSNKCALCMRCVYICPVNAIESNMFGFSILKDGFSIKDMEKKAEDMDIEDVKKLRRSVGFEEAVTYLEDVFKE